MSVLRALMREIDLGRPHSAPPSDLAEGLAVCQIPGASLALIEDGRITETLTSGVLRAGGPDPVTDRSLFQAASISKAVAAACALRLVAAGDLDLDGDVNDRLTSWRLPANDGWQPRVTLRQLLGHTAGTTVSGLLGYPDGAPVPTVPALLDGGGNSDPVRVVSVPGTRFGYSGGGYTVVQQLVCDVTGRDFPDLATDLVLGPLGMTRSTFAQPLPAALAGDAASGHRVGPTALAGVGHTYPEMAAAGLWTTPTDLARFFLALRSALAGEPGALLPRDLADAMATRSGPTTPYGLGLQLSEPDLPASIGHGGGNEGFKCQATLFLDGGRGAVVMTNGDYGHALITEALLPALAKGLGWPTRPAPVGGPPVAGRFTGDDGEFLVTGDAADLALTAPGQAPVVLRPVGDGAWRAGGLNVTVRFPTPDSVVITQDAAPGQDIHATLAPWSPAGQPSTSIDTV
ncbi:serine hydrolase domain-containing protein [Longispora urticae]